MAWHRLTKFESSLLFSPKVTPDPNDAKRLAEKFALAMRKRDQETSVRVSVPPSLRVVASSAAQANKRK